MKINSLTSKTIHLVVVILAGAQVLLQSGCSNHVLTREDIIDTSSEIKLILNDGFQFTEGPVSDKQGNVYFTDIPASRIYTWMSGRTNKIILSIND